jgi:lysophospholipase L1-like esterase
VKWQQELRVIDRNPGRARSLSCAGALLLLSAGAVAQTPAPDASALEQSLTAEVERFVEADRVMPPASCQVLFVGSSSIANWKATLAEDMAPIPVINRGIGDAQIEFENHWFDRIVAPYRPRAIVFYAGENDLNFGKPVQQVIADFDTFMELKEKALGETPVYFISLKPSRKRYTQFPLQSEVNAAIRRRAAERNDLHFIDVVPLMLNGGRPKDIFLPDDLHMSRVGYLLWTQAVRAALLPVTEAEARACRQGEKP